MKKYAIAISLYIGTFTVASAGFYLDKINQEKDQVAATTALLAASAITTDQKRGLPALNGDYRKTADLAALENTASNGSVNEADKRRSISKPTAIAGGSEKIGSSRPGSGNTGFDDTGLDNNSDTDEYIDTATADDFAASSYAVNNISLATGSSDTGVVASAASTGVDLTTINSAAETTQTDTTSTADISSQQADELSSTVIETTDEQVLDELSQDEFAEQQWATPDCPFILAEGSSEEYASGMTEAYGCRYRSSCVNQNDGSGTYYCRWQYIRPS